jgi:nucleoside-triphosphatase THEP1
MLRCPKGALDIPLWVGLSYRVSFYGHSRTKQRALRDCGSGRSKKYARLLYAGDCMTPSSSHQETTDGGEETVEWRHENAPVIPAEHAILGLSQIGAIVYDDGLVRDAVIAQCAADLAASGYRLGGVVQSNAHRRGRRRCDMFVKDLLGGGEIKISLDRGNEARGCRLDPDAFARVDAWVEHAVLERVDLLIINKFGKEEAHGRGLRPVIAEALIADIPLVIGVSTRNLCDFLTFVGDSATRLTPDAEAITAWCRNAIGRGAHHRCQPRLTSVPA